MWAGPRPQFMWSYFGSSEKSNWQNQIYVVFTPWNTTWVHNAKVDFSSPSLHLSGKICEHSFYALPCSSQTPDSFRSGAWWECRGQDLQQDETCPRVYLGWEFFCRIFSDHETNNQPKLRRATYVCPAKNHGALLPEDFLPSLRNVGPCGLVKADNTKTCLRKKTQIRNVSDFQIYGQPYFLIVLPGRENGWSDFKSSERNGF